MEILYWFEGIRNTFLDYLFLAITYLGSEVAFMVVGMLVFWCVNKRCGYFIFTTGLFGTAVIETMKTAFKIPRPWIKDYNFKPVSGAVAEATGYSFPSGHTKNAATTFGAIFLSVKKAWVKVLMVVIAVLVAISRMYLGVHTVWDVLGAIGISLIILIATESLFKDDKTCDKAMPYIVGGLLLATVGYFIYTMVAINANVLTENLSSAGKNARSLLGCSVALVLTYVFDRKITKFETKASWYVQVIKLVLGLGIVIAIKTFLKTPLAFIFGEENERIFRYFLLTFVAGALWPMTFKYLCRIKIAAFDRFGEWVKNIFTKKKTARTQAKK